MKLTLPDALHARPASLLVRVASSFACDVHLSKDAKRANAKSILEVLGLGAAKGDTIEITTDGADASDALEALTTLITRNFSTDLVPETGSSAALGIAIGSAHVLPDSGDDDAGEEISIPERFERARAELDRDILGLSQKDRELLEPERAILAELETLVAKEVGSGVPFRDAVTRETARGMTDLFLDARTRLLSPGHHAHFEGLSEPTILVAPSLPPSLVAAMPVLVVGIVSALSESEEKHGTGNTSHAAILARSKGVPLAFVDSSVTEGILGGERMVLDVAEDSARVWVDPSEELVLEMSERRDTAMRARADENARVANLARNTRVAVRVNVSHAEEEVPEHARGVGLVRTELVFAGHRARPSVAEQATLYRIIVARAKGHPVSIRLFDAGGDKPLSWLASETDARGVALLFHHENALKDQLNAIGDSRAAGDARALIPLTRSAEDVRRVRALCPEGLRVGAMIETKDAAERADEIAREADFLSIGTNDLTASVLGVARADSKRGLEDAVWRAIVAVVNAARANGREVTVCGELAAHAVGAVRLADAGVHALSVAIPAFSSVIALVARKPEGES